MTSSQSSHLMHMMPIHFGPHAGPRQRPDGDRFVADSPTNRKRYSLKFRTDSQSLEALLPPGFALAGDPVVAIEMSELRNISWLAGRGYNILGVSFPAAYQGREREVKGLFLSVLWENMTDPILTGREQLGYNKIYADISDAAQSDGKVHITASWEGFEFFSMTLRETEGTSEVAHTSTNASLFGEGILHFKYIPKTGGNWNEADAAYATLSPWQSDLGAADTQADPRPKVTKASGEFEFKRATWEQMPTQFRIVNRLAELDIIEMLGGSIVRSVERNDHRAQRILT